MDGIFEQSSELVQIINSYGWSLYDLTGQPKDKPFSWEELNGHDQSKLFELSHNYLFVPIPKPGETLRQAYSVTKGLGPCLTIEDPDHPRWNGLKIHRKPIGFVAIFSRLWFFEDYVFVFTPAASHLPEPDLLGIKYNYLIDTFRKYFGIIVPTDLDTITVPPPPRDSNLN